MFISYILLGGIVKKEEFKEFVKKNPILVDYVKKDEMTWQKFYEMYDLYGEENNIWDKYIKKEAKNTSTGVLAGLTLGEVVNWVKNIDLDGLQEGIGNVQRVLGVIEDFSSKGSKNQTTYKPKPLYKHFDD